MGRVPEIIRIRAEDFPEEQQDVINRLAYSLNTFMDQTIALLDGNVDSTNIAREIKDITVETDGSGVPTNLPLQLSVNLNRRPAGILCIKADNLTDTLSYPAGAPWISWTINNVGIKIADITNLTANQKWRLRLLIIGEDV